MTNNSLLNIKKHFHSDPFISYEESAGCQAKRRNRLWSPKVHINAKRAAKHVTHTKILCLQNAVGTQDALHFAEAEKLQRWGRKVTKTPVDLSLKEGVTRLTRIFWTVYSSSWRRERHWHPLHPAAGRHLRKLLQHSRREGCYNSEA